MSAHLPALNHGRMDPASALYTIRITGHLGATLRSEFPEPAWPRHGAETVLTGLPDRPAGHGVLAGNETLGLDLFEVRQLTPEPPASASVVRLEREDGGAQARRGKERAW
jgi:hypothetical protein